MIFRPVEALGSIVGTFGLVSHQKGELGELKVVFANTVVREGGGALEFMVTIVIPDGL